VTSVSIPPTISFIDCEAFSPDCEVTVSECDSCVEMARWTTTHFHSHSHSAVDFRRTLRIGSELPILANCLVDLSQFEAVRALGLWGQGHGSSYLYRRRSDGIQFVVEFIVRLDAGKGKGRESEVEKAVERRLNLRHPCIAAPIGFAVSGCDSGDAIELRTIRPYAEGGSLADILALPPPRWTATAKALAVVGLALGLRFANGVGQSHGRLRPSCVLFDGAGAIQIAGIGAVPSGGCGCGAEFVAPEVDNGGVATAKADVFSFARIVSRITADDPHRRAVPRFVADLIEAGLSADPRRRWSFGAIVAGLEANRFEIEEGVDSEAVSAFVRAVEGAEP
jgi:hypothetical protein